MEHLHLTASEEQPEEIMVVGTFGGFFEIKTRREGRWYSFADHDQLSVAIDIAITLSEASKFNALIEERDSLTESNNKRRNQIDKVLLETMKEVEPDFKWVFEKFLNY